MLNYGIIPLFWILSIIYFEANLSLDQHQKNLSRLYGSSGGTNITSKKNNIELKVCRT